MQEGLGSHGRMWALSGVAVLLEEGGEKESSNVKYVGKLLKK